MMYIHKLIFLFQTDHLSLYHKRDTKFYKKNVNVCLLNVRNLGVLLLSLNLGFLENVILIFPDFFKREGNYVLVVITYNKLHPT